MTNRTLTKELIDPAVFGKRAGISTFLFGCWHTRLTRPLVIGKTAYRACVNCGARRPYCQDIFTDFGSFYYPPIIKTGCE